MSKPKFDKVTTSKPNLQKHLFWDWRYDDIDWQASYRSIIERVVERGTEEEVEELNRFYGKDRVVYALLHEIVYLPDYVEVRVERLYNLRREELACYTRKQSRRGYWI